MGFDIGREIQKIKTRLTSVERSARLSHASIDDTSIQVRDATGNLRGLLGVQADGTTAVNIVNGAAPPAPSTPTVSPALGGIAAGWDGTFADGSVTPLDWARVEVHTSTTDGFTPTPATLAATIETPQGGICYVPATGPTYVRLLARNTSGAASTPTSQAGPYSPRPVAGDIGIGEIVATMISDGAVTTPKIFANAVTTAKLSVGSVDATALAADAITGKTITGGTITGAVIQTATSGQRITLNEGGSNKVLVYNSSGTAIGDFSMQGLAVKGTNGSVLWLDPNNAFPNLRMTNAAQTNSAVINVSENTAGAADIGINSGTFTASSFSDMKWRTFLGNDFWVAERIRDSAPTTYLGGRVFLGPASARIGYLSSADPTKNSSLYLEEGRAQISGGHLELFAPASASSVLYADGAAGHTGNLLRLSVDSTEKFKVDKDGNAAVAGNLTVTGIGQKLFARKTSDAPARTSTTPSADPHLSVTVQPGTYRLEAFIKWSGDPASDINWSWNSPASSAGSWVCYSGDTAMSAIPTTMRNIDTAVTGGSRSYGVIATVTSQAFRGTVRITNAGTFSANWAAQTAGGTGVVLYTDSWIYLERVE